MGPITAVIICLVLLWAINKAILIVPEGSVVQTFALGKFHKAYGPGLHVGWFDKAIYKQVKLKIGMVAMASSDQSIETAGLQIPAIFADTPQISSSVRIERFEGTKPVVTHRGVPNERRFKCEKCGHENAVRV